MKAMIDSKVKELISTNALTMKNRGQKEYIDKLMEMRTEQNKSVIDDLIQQLNAQSKGVDEVIQQNKNTIDLLFGKAA
jgi:spore coat protein CotF